MTSIVRLLRQLHARLAQHPPHTGNPTLAAPNLPARRHGLNYQDMDNKRQPIAVQLPDYVGSAVGDGITLYWDNVEVAFDVFNADHQAVGMVTFLVLPDDIPLGVGRSNRLDTIATYPLHYHVLRTSGNDVFSADTSVLVKTTVPGGLDPNPTTPENENLALPQGIPANLDTNDSWQTVEVVIALWQNAYPGDVLTLYWAGERIVHVLAAGEENLASITISVPRTLIVDHLGQGIIVTYDVRDVVNNWSRFSFPVRVNVEDGSTLLREPEINEALGGILDLDTLGSADVNVYIPANPGSITNGMDVELVWTGTTAQGTTLQHKQTHTLAGNDASRGFDLVVPNREAAPLSGGRVRVVYQTVASPVRRSRAAEAVVVGTALALDWPEVRHVSGTTLQLALVGSGPVQVTVPVYDVMGVGDGVDLFWRATTSTGTVVEYTAHVNVDSNQNGQPVLFAVPNEYAVVLAGSNDLRVSYLVTTVDQVPHDSPTLTLSVTAVGGTLIAPWLKDFPSAVIDPSLVVGSTQVMVGGYTGKAVGDEITVNWVGDTYSTAPYYPVHAGNLNQDIAFTIAKTPYVDGNSRVELSYQVKRAGGGNAGSITLPVTIQAGGSQPLPLPVVVEANPADVLDPVNARNGATIRITDPNFLPGDVIAAFWVGSDGLGTPTLEWVPYASGFTVDVPVPASAVAANLGRSVQVLYSRIRGGVASPASDSLTLQVRDFAEGALPKPTILTVADGNLDLNTLLGDATVHIAPWPLITQGQRVWLRLHSTDDQNEPWSTELILGEVVTAAEVSAGVSRVVPRAVLLKLQNSAAVNLEVKVGFDGGLGEGAATVFPIGSYVMINVVLDLRAPEVAYQQDGYLDPALVPETGLPVTVTYGGMAQGQEVQVIMAGPNGAEHALGAQTVAPGQTALDVKVPKSVMGGYHEKILVIYYTVSLVAGGLKQSSSVVAFRYEASVDDRIVDYTKFGPVDYLNGWAPSPDSVFGYYPNEVVPKAGYTHNSSTPTIVGLRKAFSLPVGNYHIMFRMIASRDLQGHLDVNNNTILEFHTGTSWGILDVELVSVGQPLIINVTAAIGVNWQWFFDFISIVRVD